MAWDKINAYRSMRGKLAAHTLDDDAASDYAQAALKHVQSALFLALFPTTPEQIRRSAVREVVESWCRHTGDEPTASYDASKAGAVLSQTPLVRFLWHILSPMMPLLTNTDVMKGIQAVNPSD